MFDCISLINAEGFKLNTLTIVFFSLGILYKFLKRDALTPHGHGVFICQVVDHFYNAKRSLMP